MKRILYHKCYMTVDIALSSYVEGTYEKKEKIPPPGISSVWFYGFTVKWPVAHEIRLVSGNNTCYVGMPVYMHCSFLLCTHCNSVVTMACLIHGQETHKQCTWNIFLCVLTLYSSEDNVPTSLAIKTEIIIKIPLTRKHSRHNKSFIFLVLAKMFWEKNVKQE